MIAQGYSRNLRYQEFRTRLRFQIDQSRDIRPILDPPEPLRFHIGIHIGIHSEVGIQVVDPGSVYPSIAGIWRVVLDPTEIGTALWSVYRATELSESLALAHAPAGPKLSPIGQ